MTSSGAMLVILKSARTLQGGRVTISRRTGRRRICAATQPFVEGGRNMGHSRLRFLGLVAAGLVFVAACGGTTSSGGASPSPKAKIGLVTDIGGLNDKSFNHLAYVGLEKAKQDFGIEDHVVESKTGNDYVPNLTNFASKGYDLVIGVGFLMSTAVGTVSGQFPNVHFAIIDAAGTDAN